MKTDVKKSAVTPTNNYKAPNLKQNPVAPARKGFQPKSSTQMEQKDKYSSYKGYESGKTGKPEHCDIGNKFGREPKKMAAAGQKISNGTSAPMAKRNGYNYASSAGKMASGKRY